MATRPLAFEDHELRGIIFLAEYAWDHGYSLDPEDLIQDIVDYLGEDPRNDPLDPVPSEA
jgi:hypothetical protein